MNYYINFSCISDKGHCRSINQDNYICDGQYMNFENSSMNNCLNGHVSTKFLHFFGIFDGMGGEECGEIASLIAAKNASDVIFGKDVMQDVLKYCQKTNDDICRYAQEHSVSSMGTTAAILVFKGNEIVLCNIGDSKIFRFSDGILEQISKDHVTISAYGTKPPLSQNLGIPTTELIIEPYIAKGQCNYGDVYLICSDGLTDMVECSEIKRILKNTKFDEIAESLLAKALANGGRDNISIIVCRIEHKSKSIIKKIFRI